MENLTILFIVLSALLLVALIVALTKRGSSPNAPTQDASISDDDLRRKVAELEKQLQSKQISGDAALNEAQEQLEQLEAKRKEILESTGRQIKNLESQLQSANARIKALEADATSALSGNNAELLKAKLDEAAALASKVAELDAALESARLEAEVAASLKETIEKQKKKLKSLEDELEEIEEERDDAQKKSKKLLAMNEELQGDLEKATKSAKQYLADFNDTKQRLEALQADFNLKEEALDFVKEILTAPRTSDESVAKLYENVSSTVDYIRNELRDALKETGYLPYDIENRFFKSELDTWAITKRKSWIQGKVSIAFVGEFSAGKTSIVNRLLSQDDPNVPRLPVSTKATTAIPTYISGGLSTYYQFVTPDNELKKISEATFKRVSKEVLDQVKGVSSLIQYFVMTYNNPNLDKMSILDTPGFNSNDSEDTERTIGVINECDALFWVFDVNAGTVNRSSLKIIKEHLKKPLYVVINQIDTKDKSDVDAVEALIRKTLESEGVKVQGIIRFSKKEPLNVMLDPIRNINRDVAREALLADLIDFVASAVDKSKIGTKLTQRNSNKLEKTHDQLISKFGAVLDSLRDDCVEVSEIPEYNSRFFSEDDYRISQEKYQEFIGLLQRISEEEIDEVIELYNQQIETVQSLEQSWEEHSVAQEKQVKLTNCLDKLKAKAKLFEVKVEHRSYHSSINGPSSSSRTSTTQAVSTEDTVKQFKQSFKWSIIELNGNSVKLNWDMVKNIIQKLTNKDFPGNMIRQSVPTYGVQGFTDIDTVATQIMTFVSKNR